MNGKAIASEPMELKAEALRFPDVLWTRHALARHLWSLGWKNDWTRRGCTWPLFEQAVAANRGNAMLWLQDAITWNEFESRLHEVLTIILKDSLA